MEALRAERSLNPRPEAVVDEAFGSSEFFDARDLVQVKYEMVRRVRVDGDAVSRSAAAFGFSRPSFYEAAASLDAGGLPALVPARPGPRRRTSSPTRWCPSPASAGRRIRRCARPIWPTPSPSGSGCGCIRVQWNGRWPDPFAPTAEEAGERAADGGVDVERYEQLRRRALGGEADGWRLGLGVLCHRGVAAWLRAWHTTAPPTAIAAPPARRALRLPRTGRRVGVDGVGLPDRR